ncbi:MAG: hypothetical protein IKU43_06155 [Clostridia bacterium]|nr:hypothetical protein [Clostridia bacterium]
MKTKRILALLLAGLVATSAVACKKDGDKTENEGGAYVQMPEEDEKAKIAALSPEEYLEYVVMEKHDLPMYVSAFTDSAKSEYSADSSAKGSVRLTTGDGTAEFIGAVNPGAVEQYKKLSWLSDIGIEIEADTTADGLISTPIDLKVNNVHVIDLILTADTKKEMLFATLPELNEKAIGISVPDFAREYAPTLLSYALIDALPEGEDTEALAEKYLAILLEAASNVTKEADSVTVSEISQDVNCVSFDITPDDLYNATVKLAETAVDDPAIKAVFEEISDELYASGGAESFDSVEAMIDATYNEFDRQAENLKKYPELYTISSDIAVNLYTSTDDELIGFEVFSDEYSVLECLTAEKDDEFAFVVSAEDFIVEGTGSTEDGKCFMNAEVKAYLDGENAVTVMTVNVDGIDTELLEDGFFNGTITVKPGRDFALSIGQGGDILAECEAVISFTQTNLDDANTVITFNYKGKKVLSLDAYGAMKSPSEIVVPTSWYEATNKEDMQKFMQDIDTTTVITNLSEAGILNKLFSFMG